MIVFDEGVGRSRLAGRLVAEFNAAGADVVLHEQVELGTHVLHTVGASALLGNQLDIGNDTVRTIGQHPCSFVEFIRQPVFGNVGFPFDVLLGNRERGVALGQVEVEVHVFQLFVEDLQGLVELDAGIGKDVGRFTGGGDIVEGLARLLVVAVDFHLVGGELMGRHINLSRDLFLTHEAFECTDIEVLGMIVDPVDVALDGFGKRIHLAGLAVAFAFQRDALGLLVVTGNEEFVVSALSLVIGGTGGSVLVQDGIEGVERKDRAAVGTEDIPAGGNHRRIFFPDNADSILDFLANFFTKLEGNVDAAFVGILVPDIVLHPPAVLLADEHILDFAQELFHSLGRALVEFSHVTLQTRGGGKSQAQDAKDNIGSLFHIRFSYWILTL